MKQALLAFIFLAAVIGLMAYVLPERPDLYLH